MKFGIIVFGNIAKKFVKSIEYTTEGQVIAIASRSISLDYSYLIAHPEVKVYHDYEKMLNNPEIEAVYIALPHLHHKEWIIKAIQCHKAVISEKPLVLKCEDIDEIENCVQQYKGYCLEAFKTKFNHGFDALKKDLSLIGNIKTIETNFCSVYCICYSWIHFLHPRWIFDGFHSKKCIAFNSSCHRKRRTIRDSFSAK